MDAFGTRVWVSLLVVGLLGSTVSAVNVDTVPVGNPGNAADARYETPSHGVVAYTYNIGKYEVTAGQYTVFLNAVAGVDTYGLYNTNLSRTDFGSGIARSGGGTVDEPYTYSVAADFVSRPVNFVSWGDAARFANWLCNGQPIGAQSLATTEDGSYMLNGATSVAALSAVVRRPSATWVIPSEDEWYKAAYYKGGSTNAGYWDYPTRSDTAPGQDMSDPFGNNANYFASSGAYLGSTALVGEFQNSESPYGTFDQAGNVWEWNEALYAGSYRGLRGGAFDAYGYDLRASGRISYHPTDESLDLGFRVAEVPEPATIMILILASMGVLGRKRA